MDEFKQAIFQTAPTLTEELLRQHYLQNPQLFYSHLDDHVMWIGPLEHQYVFNKEKVMEILKMDQDTILFMMDAKFQLVCMDENSCVVSGWIAICTDKDSGHILKCHQSVSFIYRLVEMKLWVTHIHVSENWNIFAEGELFPFRAANQTYQYMQQLVRMKLSNYKKLMVYDTRRHAHFIMENEIIYIEASNIHCYLYCLNGKILVTEGISVFYRKLSDRFIRVHRSYIVNVDFVVGMERFYVQLCENVKVPVPEKKYVAIREKIRQKMPFKMKRLVKNSATMQSAAT